MIDLARIEALVGPLPKCQHAEASMETRKVVVVGIVRDALDEVYERMKQQDEGFTQIIEQQKRMLDMAWQQFDAMCAHDYEDEEDWLSELVHLVGRSGQEADDAAAEAWFGGEPR